MNSTSIIGNIDPQIGNVKQHSNTLSFLKEKTQNEVIWNGFVIKAMESVALFGTYDAEEHLLTSCSANFCALLIIFNGLEKTSEYMKTLAFTTLFTVRSKLNKKIYVYNLGGEHAILKANKEYAKAEDFKFTEEYAYQTKKLNKYQDNLIDEIKNGKSESAQNSQLDASHDVINAMLKEIENNEKFVNETDSYVYQVMIRQPTEEFNKALSEDDLVHNPCVACYHCFIIEQFKLPKGEVRYFLHHSWVHQFSLATNLESKSYDEKGSWSKLKLIEFLDSLNILLSQDKTLGNIKLIMDIEQNCFGVKNKTVSSALAINKQISAISGKSLRYISSKISLAKCEENFNKFISP